MLLIIDDYIELALAVHEVGIKISNVKSVWQAHPGCIGIDRVPRYAGDNIWTYVWIQ